MISLIYCFDKFITSPKPYPSKSSGLTQTDLDQFSSGKENDKGQKHGAKTGGKDKRNKAYGDQRPGRPFNDKYKDPLCSSNKAYRAKFVAMMFMLTATMLSLPCH